MKLFELTIDDSTDEIIAISIVENPAIQSDFVFFNEQKEILNFAEIDKDERKLVGAILIPDKKILRIDEDDNSEYEVFFSKSTVAKLAQNYLKNKYVDRTTLEHDKKIKGLSLVESWIKESKLNDKSNIYGLNAPLGSWIGVFQIDRTTEGDDIWNNYVKTGKVKGFSIEALLSHKLIKASSQIDLEKHIEELSENEVNVLLGQIKAIIRKDKRYGKGQRVEMESYSDYPDGVKGNARAALKYANDNGWGSCGTPVGKQRANQLAKGESISLDTIKRMYSFLSRHAGDLESSKGFTDGCGYLMYMAWGGKSALSWSRNKLRELGLLELKEGVPHYTKDGILYEGPYHKNSEGRLMSGKVHSEVSRYLYHKEELEALPSITSTYPGEIASGSISPALID